VRSSETRKVAVIDITIRSTGEDFRSDGTEANAAVDLKGEVIVNLDTMLDEALELKGTICSGFTKGAESTKVKLPIHLLATKSFVKDGPIP
jgi:hypothetical protein